MNSTETNNEGHLNTQTNAIEQRQRWIDLRKRIEGMTSKISNESVSEISSNLFSLNIIRGRGILCRSVLYHVLKDYNTCPKYAALICIINSKFPEVGELLLSRLVCIFKRAFCHNNRQAVDHIVKFICELTIQVVVDEILLLQILQLCIEGDPTDDTIRITQTIIKRAGGFLSSASKLAMDMVFEQMRLLLQNGQLLTISQKRITDCLRLRRDGMVLNLDPNLDLVEDDNKEAILIDLSQPLDPQSYLNYFHVDPDFDESENSYKELTLPTVAKEEKELETEQSIVLEIVDMTDAELIQKQKLIYLTIMSSMSPDEAVHKLLKISRSDKLENSVLIDMVIKCCAQEKTYSKYFGVIGEKICRLSPTWNRSFTSQFQEKYDTIYQYEGSQLRNIGKFFGHLIAVDTLPLPETLGHIVLTEDNTTSAGRVFIKFLFQEIVEELGIDEVNSIICDETIKDSLRGMFPRTNILTHDLEHLMFSINYFTAIGLGVLTQEMRLILNDLQLEPRGRKRSRSNEASNTGSLSPSRSYSRSFSRSYTRSRSYSRSRSNSRSGSRAGSRSRSFSRSRSSSR